MNSINPVVTDEPGEAVSGNSHVTSSISSSESMNIARMVLGSCSSASAEAVMTTK